VRIRVRRRSSRAARSAQPLAAGALAACITVAQAGPALAQEKAEPRAAGGALQGQAPVLRFEIAAGRLGDALDAFRALTGAAVSLPANVAELDSPGVAGVYTAEQALSRLLEGTGVAWRATGPAAYTLELRLAESVEVTARLRPSSPKYTEPLRDLPQTIVVVPAAVIEQQGATTLRDVLRNVTGISVQAGEGGGGLPGDNLSVRGFPARSDIFVDGLRDFGAYSRDPFNVEQVEVSKGPASAYAGRGSTGGSINLASKTPQLQAQRDVSFGIGTAEYKRGTLDVNQPIGVEGAAFRLNAMWTDADVAGRDAVTNERYGIAPSLSFGLGSATRFNVN
jgi:catecholate siderophore receptor